jgi:hypothetical protein
MMFDPFDGGGFMFRVVPVIMTIGFIAILGIVLYRVVKGAQQWKRNNDSPVLTVEAHVVTKRTDVSHYHHANTTTNTMDNGQSITYYYVTFEVASGDRMEFHVENTEYGLMAEGDTGKLTFQGTRYLGFTRGI